MNEPHRRDSSSAKMPRFAAWADARHLPARPLIWLLTLVLLLGALSLWHVLHPPLHHRVATPYEVNGETVEIPPQSPTLSYIDFAEARLGAPLVPEPVPGRVGVDESRAEPVVAPLQGRIDAVAVRLGQRVNPGDRLISVRSSALVDLLHEIEVLRASESARAKTVERLKALVELRAAAEKDLLNAELELNEVRLSLQAAELKLRSRPMQVANDGAYWLLAPREGVVVERNALVGEEVGPDRLQPLLVIAELSEVIVTADVPEHDAVSLRPGGQAEITSVAVPGRKWNGEIEYVSEVVDPVRRMVNVRVRAANPEHLLRPNAFVQVTFLPAGEPRIVVPAEAVITDDQRAFVFVASPGPPLALTRRPVTTGRQNEQSIEILAGLQPGEKYVARGALLLLNAVDLAH